MPTTKAKTEYVTGLDLGTAQDFTAFAVLEKTYQVQQHRRQPAHYAIRHLERFPLGTSFPEVFDRLVKLFAESPLRKSRLIVDQTGAGKPVVDLLRERNLKVKLRRLVVTGGWNATRADSVWQVPKQELVSTLQVLLQSHRLKVPTALAEAQTLVRELANFKMKVSVATNDPVQLWREGPHDDLVLATAMAAWQGERLQPFTSCAPGAHGGCPRLW